MVSISSESSDRRSAVASVRSCSRIWRSVACASSGLDQKSGEEAVSLSRSSALRAALRSKIAPEREEPLRGAVQAGEQVIAFGHGFSRLRRVPARSRTQRRTPKSSTQPAAKSAATGREYPQRVHAVLPVASRTVPRTIPGRFAGSSATTLPLSSTIPETPVIAARTRKRPFSRARRDAPAASPGIHDDRTRRPARKPERRLGAAPLAPGLSLIATLRGARSKD